MNTITKNLTEVHDGEGFKLSGGVGYNRPLSSIPGPGPGRTGFIHPMLVDSLWNIRYPKMIALPQDPEAILGPPPPYPFPKDNGESNKESSGSDMPESSKSSDNGCSSFGGNEPKTLSESGSSSPRSSSDQYDNGQREYENNQKDYTTGQKEYNNGHKEYNINKKDYGNDQKELKGPMPLNDNDIMEGKKIFLSLLHNINFCLNL